MDRNLPSAPAPFSDTGHYRAPAAKIGTSETEEDRLARGIIVATAIALPLYAALALALFA